MINGTRNQSVHTQTTQGTSCTAVLRINGCEIPQPSRKTGNLNFRKWPHHWRSTKAIFFILLTSLPFLDCHFFSCNACWMEVSEKQVLEASKLKDRFNIVRASQLQPPTVELSICGNLTQWCTLAHRKDPTWKADKAPAILSGHVVFSCIFHHSQLGVSYNRGTPSHHPF